MNRAPALLLSGIAMVLAGVVLVEYLGRPSEFAALNRPSRAAPAIPPQGAAPPGADLTGSWVGTALARPLFNRSRRPPPGAAMAQSATPGMPRLTAVLISADGRSAIFAGSGGGKPIVAREGTQVGNHWVQTIAEGQVTVIGPDGAHVLHPSFAGGPPPAGVPPAPASAASPSAPQAEPGKPSILDQIRFGKSGGVGIPGLTPAPAPGG